jgi:hypothetical protein
VRLASIMCSGSAFRDSVDTGGTQGLKPVSIVGLDGMVEAMPLHFSVPEARVRTGMR